MGEIMAKAHPDPEGVQMDGYDGPPMEAPFMNDYGRQRMEQRGFSG